MSRVTGVELRVENLVSGYGSVRIVNGVSLSALPGRLTVIIGPNGCGKSTLLRSIAGLLPVMSGSVKLGEDDVTRWPMPRRTQSGMSFVPQERSLFPAMSVRENMILGSWCSRKSSSASENIAHALEAFPALKEWEGKHAASLSGGQQRQVEVARALVNNPSMLLLDEPTAGVAPAQVGDMLGHLRRLVDDWGVGVLLVEQNVPEALEVADYVYSLVNGRNDLEGPVEDFRRDLTEIVRRWMRSEGTK